MRRLDSLKPLEPVTTRRNVKRIDYLGPARVHVRLISYDVWAHPLELVGNYMHRYLKRINKFAGYHGTLGSSIR